MVVSSLKISFHDLKKHDKYDMKGIDPKTKSAFSVFFAFRLILKTFNFFYFWFLYYNIRTF